MENVSDSQSPKVFISHASEDKERFVIDFSEKLVNKGINVWLDKWEMFPGDKLIDKIFDEGIKEADTVIIVLSNNSVEKPWVKEELDAAVVKRINSRGKIIPIILDNCPVPVCLQSTVWVKIENIKDYQYEFDRIVASIYRTTEKPQLGGSPKYSLESVDVIPPLTKVDSIVFKKVCEDAIERESLFGKTNALNEMVSKFDIDQEQLLESLEILEYTRFIKLTRALGGSMGSRIPLYQVTPTGLQEYSRVCIPDYEEMVKSVTSYLVNNKSCNSNVIASATNLRKVIVENILESLAGSGLINIQTYMGGILVGWISPQLKRIAESK